MSCSNEHFTQIYEWKKRSPSSGSLGSFFWILAVEIVMLGSASMIYFPLTFPFSGSNSRSENAPISEAFNSATNDCLVRHSLVLWVGILWNSFHFPVSFFDFVVLLFSCRLQWVALSHPALALSFGLRISRSKVSLPLFELLLNFDNISIHHAERGDVQELHLFLDVPV